MSDFGTRLKEHRLRTKDPMPTTRNYLTQSRLAELLDIGVSGKLIGHWESGERKIKHTDRFILETLIKVLFRCSGIQSLKEANELLQLGFYSPLSGDEIQKINPQWFVERERTNSEAIKSFGIIFAWNIIIDWLDSIFNWSQADAHARTSWAGMTIWSISSLTDRFSTDNLFAFLSFIFMWIAAAWSLVPILQWPLTTVPIRLQATLTFAAAWIGLPLLIALFTEADTSANMEKGEKPKVVLFMLKYTGALVGFNVMILVLLFVAIGWYYLTLPSMVWVWRFAVLLPMVMGIIGAKRIPADRLKMYGGSLRVHPADKWFLVVFFFAGPLVGAALFWWYPFFANPATGTSFLLLLIGIILWYRQKQRPLHEPVLIFLLGFVIPLAILWLLIFLFPIENPPIFPDSFNDILVIALVFSYFLSFSTLWITLQLRNPARLTLMGAVGFLITTLLLLGVIQLNAFWGLIAVGFTVAFWFFGGKRRFQEYLWIHPAFTWLVVTSGFSLYILTRNLVPIWLNLLSFVVVAIGLIVWGYQPKRPTT